MAAAHDALATPATSAGFLPGLIYGTMEANEMDAPSVKDAVLAALRAGYRAIDMAEHYTSCKGGHVGEALKQAQEEDDLPRSELWLTHKLDGMPVGDYEEVKARVQAMLELAQTDYLDALLIHYPGARGTDLGGDPSELSTVENWDWFAANIEDAWANMAKLKQEGLVLHLGVSNFYTAHLEELAKYTSTEAPCEFNELFIDAAHPETELVEACQAQGISVMAYRPTAFVMNLGLLEGPMDTLQALADADDALDGPQAVILRALHNRRIAPITGTRNSEHMVSNLKAIRPARPLSEGEAEEGHVAVHKLDLSAVEDQAGMVEMMGGADEYALSFKAMAGVAADEATAEEAAATGVGTA